MPADAIPERPRAFLMDPPPLAGRGAEQALLDDALATVLDGEGRLVLLAGEAGIGKTTLLRHLAAKAQAAGALVLEGHCYEGSGQPAFAPWHELLAELTIFTADAEPLPAPFGPGAASQTAHQLQSRIAAHLAAVATSRPLVLVLEDLHWADRDSLDLLEVVTRGLARAPMLVIGTYRQEDARRSSPLFEVLPLLQRDRPLRNLALARLSANDAAQLVAAAHGPASPALIDYLQTRAEGHPLFLVELVRDLLERRLLPRDAENRLLPPSHPVSVSALLHHLIAHRLARLGAEEETFLAVAAVIGEEWELGIVEAVLGWDEEPLLRTLEALLRADVVVPVGEEERYRFRHALIREVLYNEQLARRRKRLHQRVGAVLEASPPRNPGRYTALAHHFAAAEEWEQAVRYGIAAGDAARDRFAGHGALRAYQQALEAMRHALTPVHEFQVVLLERIGQAQLLIGHTASAEASFEQMLTDSRAIADRGGEGRALVWLSYVRRRQYQPAGSERAGADGLRVAEELGEPQLLALVHWNLSHLYEVEGELAKSAHHAAEAERLARVANVPDVLSRSLQVQSTLAIWHGRYEVAEQLAEEARLLAREGHDGLAFSAAHWRLGLALGERGRYAPALRMLLAGVAHAEALGERYYLAKLLNNVGWLYHELGDPEGARAWHQRALATVRGSHGERITEAERYALLDLATDELTAGNLEAAAAHLRTFEPLLAQHEYGLIRYLNRYQLVRGEFALVQGDAVAALAAAHEAAQLAAAKEMPKNLAKSRLLTGRALLAQGRLKEAVPPLEEGVAIADALAHGSLCWQGRLWLGQAQQALRRDASTLLHDAMAQVERQARALDDERWRTTYLSSPRVSELRDALAAAEEDLPTERPAGLTVREVDVLRLLARHQTDREIAEALFLSPRTVSSHVSNIFIKLNVGNRREAAAAAVGLGLD